MKSRDILHNLLDGAGPEPGASILQGHDAERLSHFREGLKRLEDHQEKAPDDFAARVMAALPDKPCLTWTNRLKSFRPERLWVVPGLAGALAMLVVMAGFLLFQSSRNTGLIPVVLDLYAPSAKQVELVGTFSNWMPKAFHLKGPDAVGYWAIAVKLPPGRYEYAFLINGSQVVHDDDGEALRPDGFGRENSLLLVNNTAGEFDQRYGFTADEYVTISENNPAGPVLSLPDQDKGRWLAVFDRGVASGVQRQTIENLLAHLASAHINPDQAQIILAPLFQDAQAGNPTQHVFLKIHECLLKKALPDTLKSMVQNSDEAFKKARALLTQTGHLASMKRYPALLDATAFALEDGQDPAFLGEVLTAGKGKSSDRIAAVIEAGETLHHAGLGPEALKLIMEESLQKDLNGQQMKRVTQQVMERIRKGTNPKTIRDELWV